MSGYQTIKECRGEKAAFGRQRFLALHPSPVLVCPGSAGDVGPGYFTRPQTGVTRAGASYASRIGFSPDDTYRVIPVIKAEGRPFPDRIGVGRTRGTDIVLVSSEISKYHAYFSWEGDRWFITDAKSSNGTFIDGVRQQPMATVPLDSGMLLAFGSRLHLFLTAVGFVDSL